MLHIFEAKNRLRPVFNGYHVRPRERAQTAPSLQTHAFETLFLRLMQKIGFFYFSKLLINTKKCLLSAQHPVVFLASSTVFIIYLLETDLVYSFL